MSSESQKMERKSYFHNVKLDVNHSSDLKNLLVPGFSLLEKSIAAKISAEIIQINYLTLNTSVLAACYNNLHIFFFISSRFCAL